MNENPRYQRALAESPLHCQRTAQFAYGLVIPAGKKQSLAEISARNLDGIEFATARSPRQGLLCSPLAQQPMCKSNVSSGVVRVQVERPVVLSFSIAPVPLFLVTSASRT